MEMMPRRRPIIAIHAVQLKNLNLCPETEQLGRMSSSSKEMTPSNFIFGKMTLATV